MANIFRAPIIGLPRPRSRSGLEYPVSGQPLTLADQGMPIGDVSDRLPLTKAESRVSRWSPLGSPTALLHEPSWSVYANPAQNPTITTILAYFLDGPGHAAAAVRVKAAGAAHFFENLDWSSLEATTGSFTDTLIDRTAANASPLPLWLNIATINTDGTRRVPSDLASTAWDDVAMIAAFNGFLDHLFTRVGSALQHLYIGNEVDNYFSTHATEIGAYATFLAAVRTHARTLWDVNTLQVGVTFTEAAVSHFSDFAAILAAEDIAPFTYYFLSGNSFQTDVAAIKTAIGDKPWSFQEIGFTSDVATWGSSQATQNALVSGSFAVLAPEPRFVGATWFQLSDYSDAVLTNAGYTAPFLSFYTQIGLRDTGDHPKTGWPTIVALMGGVAGELPDGRVMSMALPTVRLRADRPTIAPSLNSTVLAPFAAAPVSPVDWPLPRAKARAVTPLAYRPASATPTVLVPFPFAAVFDLPVLARYPMALRTFLHPYDAYLVPAPATAAPTSLTDWPLPLTKDTVRANRTIAGIPPLTLAGLDALPDRQSEWPVPFVKPAIRDNRTSLDPLSLVLMSQDQFFGGNGQPPTYQPGPNPTGRPYPVHLRTWTQSLVTSTLSPFVQVPLTSADWPLPRAKGYPAVLRTHIGYVVFDDNVPFAQTEWPLPGPRVALRDLRTWITPLKSLQTGLDQVPGSQHEWPLPVGKLAARDLRSHLDHFALALTGQDALPMRLTEWPLPTGKACAAFLRTFAQTTNLEVSGTDVLPGRQNLWPVPEQKAALRLLQTWTLARNLLLKDQMFGAPGEPLAQTDWPLPRPRLFPRQVLTQNLSLLGSTLGPRFQPEWAVNTNAYLGPTVAQPVTK